MSPVHTLRRVTPEVRMELERLHSAQLGIEFTDELTPSGEVLMETGWIYYIDSLWGHDLVIHPLAKTSGGALRINRDHEFVAGPNGVQLNKNGGGRS